MEIQVIHLILVVVVVINHDDNHRGINIIVIVATRTPITTVIKINLTEVHEQTQVIQRATQ